MAERFVCGRDGCTSSYISNQILEEHILSKHEDWNDPAVNARLRRCGFCAVIFGGDSANLRKHEPLCGAIFNLNCYQCRFKRCGKKMTITNRSNWERHEKSCKEGQGEAKRPSSEVPTSGNGRWEFAEVLQQKEAYLRKNEMGDDTPKWAEMQGNAAEARAALETDGERLGWCWKKEVARNAGPKRPRHRAKAARNPVAAPAPAPTNTGTQPQFPFAGDNFGAMEDVPAPPGVFLEQMEAGPRDDNGFIIDPLGMQMGAAYQQPHLPMPPYGGMQQQQQWPPAQGYFLEDQLPLPHFPALPMQAAAPVPAQEAWLVAESPVADPLLFRDESPAAIPALPAAPAGEFTAMMAEDGNQWDLEQHGNEHWLIDALVDDNQAPNSPIPAPALDVALDFFPDAQAQEQQQQQEQAQLFQQLQEQMQQELQGQEEFFQLLQELQQLEQPQPPLQQHVLLQHQQEEEKEEEQGNFLFTDDFDLNQVQANNEPLGLNFDELVNFADAEFEEVAVEY